jgi:hypothetical protein
LFSFYLLAIFLSQLFVAHFTKNMATCKSTYSSFPSTPFVSGPSGIMSNGTFYKRVEESSDFTCTSLFKDLASLLCGGKSSSDEKKEIEELKKKEIEELKKKEQLKNKVTESLATMLSSFFSAVPAVAPTTTEKTTAAAAPTTTEKTTAPAAAAAAPACATATSDCTRTCENAIPACVGNKKKDEKKKDEKKKENKESEEGQELFA